MTDYDKPVTAMECIMREWLFWANLYVKEALLTQALGNGGSNEAGK